MAAIADDTQLLTFLILAHLKSPKDIPHPVMTEARKKELYDKMKKDKLIGCMTVMIESIEDGKPVTDTCEVRYFPLS